MWRAPSILVAVVLVLLALGIVMLASTSGVVEKGGLSDPLFFLKRQLVWLAIAAVAGVVSAVFIDYHWWRKLAVPLAVVAALGLMLVFVPHIGCKVNGASRWVQIGPVRGQPSELAKFATVVMLASWMAYAGHRASRLKEGFMIPLAALGLMLALIMAEPDFGTTFLVGMTGLAIMFAGGTKIPYLLGAGTLGISGFMLAITHNPNRWHRFSAFLHPSEYPTEAYQLRQSIDAFIMGGGLGVGLGESLQKHAYLPEAHTDFILAIIGEELGLAATLLVVILFVAFFICGLVISMNASDIFGRLLGFGITMLITTQAAINIGVVTGCLPTKGLPLPFISAGGSNLVIVLFSAGVLINIARHSDGRVVDEHTRVIKDSVHWA